MFLNGCNLTIAKDLAIVELVSLKGKKRKMCTSLRLQKFYEAHIVFVKSFEIPKRNFEKERGFLRLSRHE